MSADFLNRCSAIWEKTLLQDTEASTHMVFESSHPVRLPVNFLSGPCQWLFHTFSNALKISTPPFLLSIELFNLTFDFAEKLEVCRLYPLQSPILVSFLDSGHVPACFLRAWGLHLLLSLLLVVLSAGFLPDSHSHPSPVPTLVSSSLH